jgi:hypothetical protein
VLLITPRIIRNVETPDYDTLFLRAGTDANIGANALSIGPTPPRSVSIASPQGAGGGRAEQAQRSAPPALPSPASPDAASNTPAAPTSPSAGAPPQSANLVATVSAPEQIPPGGKLLVNVAVAGAAPAVEGEAVLSFDASTLRTVDSAPGILTLHLNADASGGVVGTALFGVTATGGGQTDIRVTSGYVQMPDGSRRNFDTSAAVVTVKIGI